MPSIIAIVGGGFSGTALAAHLSKLASRPLHLILFDKSGQFGQGPAYQTPYSYHLLNVRAEDMSAFHDNKNHFVDWLKRHPHYQQEPEIAKAFLPRAVYRDYLADILKTIPNDHVTVTYQPHEVLDIFYSDNQARLILANNTTLAADKVVLATGNLPPASLPVAPSTEMKVLPNPWDYTAISTVPAHASVLIVGTGLSMIDAVLSLKHQCHQGKIYALSRHGLMPLPHTDLSLTYSVNESAWSSSLRKLCKNIRLLSQSCVKQFNDWQPLMHSLRSEMGIFWQAASLHMKEQFIRHLLPYWNIHRHRVHHSIAQLLDELKKSQQLTVVAGKLLAATAHSVTYRPRGQCVPQTLPVNILINCMGPCMRLAPHAPLLLGALLQRRLARLDPLQLGLMVNSQHVVIAKDQSLQNWLYAIGPLTKGASWECTAVPDIRKQCFGVASALI